MLLSIGEFSKMTYLSVKALRHYHDVGLLEPADIDPSSGYRLYSTQQVSTAQAIRRFRQLDMPIEQVRAVLDAPDLRSRNEAILRHLERMQQQLARTQMTVASLQALLEERPPSPAAVEYRSIPLTRSIAIRDIVRFDGVEAWAARAFEELHDTITRSFGAVAGVDGALYFDDFFEEGEGQVVAFVPVSAELPPHGRSEVIELAATDFAVLRHDGPFGELDQTYGALGTAVAERGIGLRGPIRELYLSDTTAEVCWPIDLRQQGARP